MKSLLMLWERVAVDMATRCCTCTIRDFKTVTERSRHEGISFITITLPAFGKDFERSLELGQVDRRLFQGFSWKAGLPRFLGGFLDLVFDRDSGVLLDEPSIDAILAVRQLTLMFGKISLPASDGRRRKAMEAYVQSEKEVRESDASRGSKDLQDFARISRMLFASSFATVDRKIYQGELVPKHGPGATADRIRGNGKYRQSTWPSRLEEVFPSLEYLLPSWSYYDQLENVDFLEPGAEIPVKVIDVPKTLKTPRIIAMEPVAMQYAQQAVLSVLLEGILDDGWDFDPSRIRHFLGFDDQTPNQRMAREGSLTGDLATLDLSEASDRVSNQLIRTMLEPHPHLHKAVDACRSRKADVPGHGVIRLAKFASMGSALTFPMEAMVFLTIAFVGIERELSTPLTQKTISGLKGRVRIYGDDIIVPVDYVRSVVACLELFGAKVNGSKSFWNGKFRESCGREYYNGEDISIVRVREELPTRRKHARQIISTVSLRNQLYMSGCWQAVRWLDDYIRGVIRYFPTVEPTSQVLGRFSFLGYETEKLNTDTLHRPLVRGYVVSARLPRDPLEGPGALLKFHIRNGGRSERQSPSWVDVLYPNVTDADHLERAGRPVAVNIKLRNATPF